ncbi:hypothetical protein EVAR_19425_1 [Eumeta japonica]|uniref:Uncharacterized protein n=1 Tax=Eumeta variegata TaxID=151549 RepID=A0A4C1TRX1_EUMVA|nr:hypothetical protein EVAR_19425_1 [Eumeta japonica]
MKRFEIAFGLRAPLSRCVTTRLHYLGRQRPLANASSLTRLVDIACVDVKHRMARARRPNVTTQGSSVFYKCSRRVLSSGVFRSADSSARPPRFRERFKDPNVFFYY